MTERVIELHDGRGNRLKLPAQSSEVGARLRSGWGPVNPQDRIVITEHQADGGFDTRIIEAGEYSRLFTESGGNISIQNLETTAGIAEAEVIEAEEAENRARFDNGAVRAISRGTAFANELTFGLGEGAMRQLAPEAVAHLDAVRERDPLGTLAARGAGMIASLGAGAAGLPAGATGLALRAGQAARGARALQGTGRAAGAARIAADAVAQGVVGTAGMHVTDLIAQNRPLNAERIVGDTALDIGIGLAADVGLRGAGRLTRALRNGLRRTPGRRDLVHVARAELIDTDTAPIDEVAAHLRSANPLDNFTDQGPLAPIFRPLQTASVGTGHADAIQLMNSPRARAALGPAQARLAGEHSEALVNRLNTLAHGANEATLEARGVSRLDQFSDEWTRLSTPEGMGRIQAGARDAVHEISNNLERMLADRIASTPVRAAARRLLGEGGELQGFLRSFARHTSPQEAYAHLRRFETKISRDLDFAFSDIGGKRATGGGTDVLRSAKERLSGSNNPERPMGFRNDPSVWGRTITEAESVRGRVIEEHLSGTKNLFGKLTENNTGIEGGRVFTKKRMTALLREVGRDNNETYESLVDYALRTSENARDLSRFYGTSDDAVRDLADTADHLVRELADMAQDAKLVQAHNTLLSQETRLGQAGILGMAGSAGLGGALGAATGDSENIAIGALSGLALSHVLRPGSAGARLGAMRNIFDNLTGRTQKATTRLRTNLKSKFRTPSSTTTRALLHGSLYQFRNREERREDFIAMRDSLNRVTPASLEREIGLSTLAVRQDDPELADEMAMTYVRGYQYLRQTLPQSPPSPLGGDKDGLLPSDTEMDAFIQRYEGVQDPMSMYEDLVENRLTHEKAEAVRASYPRMHAEMVNELIGVLSEFRPEEISYQYRTQVSLMLGIPMDPTHTMEFTAAMQNNGAQTTQQSLSISGGFHNSPLVTNTLSGTHQVLSDPAN